MKHILTTTTLLLLLTFFACKKKEATPAPTNTSATGGTSTGAAPSGLVASNGGDFCNLETTYQYINSGGIVTKDSSILGSFYSVLNSTTKINAGVVTLNNATIPFNNSSLFYTLSPNTSVNIAGSLTWSVSGSGTVTPFSQSFIPNYPKYTDGNLLPDTCIKANGITVNVSGVSNNQSGVFVSLSSGSNYIYKYYLGSNGSVTFSPAELNAFTTNNYLIIIVKLDNKYSATLGGIKRGFTNSLQYSKFSYLK